MMRYDDVKLGDRIEVGEVSDDLYDGHGPLAKPGEKGVVVDILSEDTNPNYSVYQVRLAGGREVRLLGFEFEVYDRPVNDPACYERALL